MQACTLNRSNETQFEGCLFVGMLCFSFSTANIPKNIKGDVLGYTFAYSVVPPFQTPAAAAFTHAPNCPPIFAVSFAHTRGLNTGRSWHEERTTSGTCSSRRQGRSRPCCHSRRCGRGTLTLRFWWRWTPLTTTFCSPYVEQGAWWGAGAPYSI